MKSHSRQVRGLRRAVSALAGLSAIASALTIGSPASAAVAAHDEKPATALTMPTQPTAIGGMVQFDSAIGRIPGVLLVGGSLTTLPVVDVNGNFRNATVNGWYDYSKIPNVRVVSGDFNHDGQTDIALIPPVSATTPWTVLPVAIANGDGTFRTTFSPVPGILSLATAPGATPVVGDFDGDGKADIALVGGAGWSTVPVAFSNGDGTFRVTNSPVDSFAGWATTTGAQFVPADFNHDGKTDIALVGGNGWSTIPVAFSNADGTFRVTNGSIGALGYDASPVANGGVQPKIVTGDFNHDGYTDIAMTGLSRWATQYLSTVPDILSVGDGTWVATENPLANFPAWATQPGVQPVVGDFNYDGMPDIALTGGAGWTTIPIAFALGSSGFRVTNGSAPNFAAAAAQPHVTVMVANDTFVAVGGTGWTTLPRAFALGDGSFDDSISVPEATFAKLASRTDFLSLNVPADAMQWSGLSSLNDGTGTLHNSANNQNLYNTHHTFGVDLDFQDSPSLWKVEGADGGTNVVKGEAVALRVWGGGWLKTGDPTWGIGLGLDLNTPSYEWYVVGGGLPGDPLNNGSFALWNSVRQDYLVVPGNENNTLTVNLVWYKDWLDKGTPPMTSGVNTYRLFNCDSAQRAVDVWVKDVTAGGQFAHQTTLNQQYDASGCPASGSTPFTYHPPATGHHYLVVATDKQLSNCGGLDDPNNTACQALATDFVSDLSHTSSSWNGLARTDVVNGVTQIVPCTVGLCGAVPASATVADFSISASQLSATLADGDTTTLAVTLTATGGFTGTPTLTVAGLPSGVTASFAPATVSAASPTSTLTLVVSSTVAAGTYPLTIATDSSLGGTGKSVTYQLTVNGEGAPQPPSA